MALGRNLKGIDIGEQIRLPGVKDMHAAFPGNDGGVRELAIDDDVDAATLPEFRGDDMGRGAHRDSKIFAAIFDDGALFVAGLGKDKAALEGCVEAPADGAGLRGFCAGLWFTKHDSECGQHDEDSGDVALRWPDPFLFALDQAGV